MPAAAPRLCHRFLHQGVPKAHGGLSTEVLLDGEIIVRGGRAQLSTEEGRTTPVRISLDLTPADYERWRAGVKEAVLKLTLTAVDD